MSSLYQETLQRFRFIEAMGYSVQYKWECEFNREKANNPEIEQYLKKLCVTTTTARMLLRR